MQYRFGLFVAAVLLSLCSLAAEAQQQALRQIEDALGNKVQVPVAPQRIITLSEIDLDTALALQLNVVGTTNGRGQDKVPYYLQQQAGRIPSVGDLGQPNLERILELEPDLILTMPNRAEVLALLNEIAPTVVTFSRDDNWQTVLQRIGDITNRQQQAADILSHYRQHVQTLQQQLTGFQQQSVSLVRWNPKGPAYMYRDSFASHILHDLGLTRPPHQQGAGVNHSLPISLEALHLIDADWVLIGTLTPAGEATDALRQISRTPAFSRLSAAQRQQVFAVDGTLWTSIGGPLAAIQVADELLYLLQHKQAPQNDFAAATPTFAEQ